jgi:hypothetical protein
MQVITMYRSTDGSSFGTEEACKAHELILDATTQIMELLERDDWVRSNGNLCGPATDFVSQLLSTNFGSKVYTILSTVHRK